MSYGRRKIYTDATEITAENVVKEVNAAFMVHTDNRNEIIELYRYYRNKTAIEHKTKEVRENINFKIGEARCLEVTNFYKGYIFGEPIQYVRREKTQNGTADDVIASDINALNGYMSDDEIGEMTVNNSFGVYGKYTAEPEGEEIPCAFDSEIKTGPAQIITTLDDGELQTFDVEIEGFHLNDKSGQNMVVRVTDEDLLDKTGGIVQGMSGSPIIQDGRLVGAVTHVFVNDPTRGYGIFIENMLDAAG